MPFSHSPPGWRLPDIQREIDDAFAAVIEQPWGRRERALTGWPAIDLYETEEEYVLLADPPGVAHHNNGHQFERHVSMREEELHRYREKLLALRARLTDEAQETLDEVADKAASPGEISHLPSHPADRDSEGLDRDVELEATREQTLEGIDDALRRVHEGSYGRCEDCGGDIPKARLDALPFAVRCVACEREHEEEGA